MAEALPTPLISRNLLSIEVARFIRREILSGNLRPGDHLVEASFAQRLQISQSPVREAFRLLEAEGLVISYPHRGSFVAKLDPRDTWELDTLRAVLSLLPHSWLSTKWTRRLSASWKIG